MEAVPGPHLNDWALVQGAVREAPGAWAEIRHRYGEGLIEIARPLAAGSQESAELVHSFLDTLQNHAGTSFAGYKPGSPLARHLAILLTNHLAPRVLDEIRLEVGRGFALFDNLFGLDLKRMVRHYFFSSGAEEDGRTAEDVYHDLLAHLIEDGGRRLLAFDGKGAFRVYLRKIVRNYWLDSVRHRRGRRRLPEPVQKLPTLEQAAFRLMAWEGLSGQETFERLQLTAGRGESEERILAAIDRIIPHVPPPAVRGADLSPDSALPEPDPDVVSGLLRWQRIRSPHSDLLTRIRRRELDAALACLREAIRGLPDDQRSFLAHRYFSESPLTPREIARRWGRPVEQVYEIGRRAMAALRGKVEEAGLSGLEL